MKLNWVMTNFCAKMFHLTPQSNRKYKSKSMKLKLSAIGFLKYQVFFIPFLLEVSLMTMEENLVCSYPFWVSMTTLVSNKVHLFTGWKDTHSIIISIHNIILSEKITYIWRNWNSMMRLLRRWRLLLLMLTKHRIWSENDVLQGAIRI